MLLSCADDDYCTVAENERGTVEITCPDGTSSTVPSCYENLPDLDGSGAVDAQDCSWVGVGLAMRQVCREPGAWLHHDECRAFDTIPILNLYSARSWKTTDLGTVDRPEFAVAITPETSNAVHYARDRDGNGVFETEESAIVADQSFCGNGCSVMGLLRDLGPTDEPGRPLLLFYAEGVAYLWRDDNGDDNVAETEIRSIGEWEATSAVLGDSLIVVGLDDTSEVPVARLWVDTNGDYVVSEEEVQLLASDVRAPSISFSRLGLLVALYVAADDSTMRWFDNDEDLVIDESEKQVLFAEGCYRARLHVYQQRDVFSCSGSAGLTLHTWGYESTWNGVGGGITTAALVGGMASGGSVMAAFTTDERQGQLWYDLNYNGAIEDTEISLVAHLRHDYWLTTGGPFLESTGGTFLNLTFQGEDDYTRMVNIHPPEEAIFLNEICDAERDRCAGALVCRISGYAEDARCVPPESD